MCEQELEENFVRSKPAHVRQLQFAEVLLKLPPVSDDTGQDKNGRLIIDDGTCHIPSMNKFEFVQKWIDTHGAYPVEAVNVDDENEIHHQSTCQIENRVGSPILGKLKKRPAKILLSQTFENLSNRSDTTVPSHRRYGMYEKGKSIDENRNFKQHLSKSDHLPLQPKDVNVQNSPILGKSQKKRKHRRVNYEAESERKAMQRSIEGPPIKRAKESSEIYDDFNSVSAKRQLILDRRKESRVEEIESPEYLREEVRIEEISSGEARSHKHESLTHLSMIIEDSDPEHGEHRIDINPTRTCKLSSNLDETNDLDGTYFSNAENMTHLVSQSIIISTETERSPTRTLSELNVSLQIMDSGKKRKKPKKGSLVERLQLLINMEKSSIRIWRHCLKQSKEKNINNPCVTVYVYNCRSRFDKQLLEGIVLEDTASLLPTLELVENLEEKDTDRRKVSILMSPELVGKIKMKSKCFIEIAPPWILLDSEDLLLDVSCVNVASFKGSVEARKNINETKLVPSRDQCVERFNCLCNLDGEIEALSKPCIERSNESSVLAALLIDA